MGHLSWIRVQPPLKCRRCGPKFSYLFFNVVTICRDIVWHRLTAIGNFGIVLAIRITPLLAGAWHTHGKLCEFSRLSMPELVFETFSKHFRNTPSETQTNLRNSRTTRNVMKLNWLFMFLAGKVGKKRINLAKHAYSKWFWNSGRVHTRAHVHAGISVPHKKVETLDADAVRLPQNAWNSNGMTWPGPNTKPNDQANGWGFQLNSKESLVHGSTIFHINFRQLFPQILRWILSKAAADVVEPSPKTWLSAKQPLPLQSHTKGWK